ncbi:TPA: Low copy number virion structural protein [Bacillus toyonensis]|nr:Low copy number virion structural protein [Bacillus toyonensis]
MFETTYIAGGRLDAPFYPTKTFPYMKGFIMDSKAWTEDKMEYVLPIDMEFYAISVSSSMYEIDDKWSLIVNDGIVCEDIYTKKIPEGISLMSYIQLKAGDKIIFKFHNQGINNKQVWIALQFLK